VFLAQTTDLSVLVLVAIVTAAAAGLSGFGINRLSTSLDNRRKDAGVCRQIKSMLAESVSLFARPARYGSRFSEAEQQFIGKFLERAHENDVAVAFSERELALVYRATAEIRSFLNLNSELGDEDNNALRESRWHSALFACERLLEILATMGLEKEARSVGQQLFDAFNEVDDEPPPEAFEPIDPREIFAKWERR
jgi:hypothetical protein